jgi:uncharacterized protein
MRVSVRVYPGSRRTGVGGRYGTSKPPVLVVRVTAPAIDGRATIAVIEALATAFRVNRNNVSVVAGNSSRNKIVEVLDADPAVLASLLLETP